MPAVQGKPNSPRKQVNTMRSIQKVFIQRAEGMTGHHTMKKVTFEGDCRVRVALFNASPEI
jgi:hypothetical protein